MRRNVSFIIIASIASGFAYAKKSQRDPRQDQTLSSADIVVIGQRDIVVNGRARRCRPRKGDALDAVVSASWLAAQSRHVALIPFGHGHFQIEPNEEQVTGPDYWQRVGIAINQYDFRSEDGQPMCIGGRAPDFANYAGFRKIVDAKPYRGKRVRFTVWVATGNAFRVGFWLAAGKANKALYNGGNTTNKPWGGNHGWTPVFLETGPIDDKADHISFGFDLQGPGDVWVYKPKFEIAADQPFGSVSGDIVIIGSQKS